MIKKCGQQQQQPISHQLQVLEDLSMPTFSREQGFLWREFNSTYGSHQVAAINPVWEQGTLDDLLREFKLVRDFSVNFRGEDEGVQMCGKEVWHLSVCE